MDAKTNEIHRSRYWYDYAVWAETYDKDVKGHMHYRGHVMAAGKIAPFMQASTARHVADLGTGTGLVLQLLRHDFPAAVLDGYDFSPAMLDKCRAKNLADTLTECDLSERHWPIRQGSVDFVTSSGLLDMIRNTGQFLGNVRDILKPGGVAALTYETQAIGRKGFLIKPSTGSHTPQEMEQMADDAGFDIVNHEHFLGYVSQGQEFRYGVITLHNPTP